MTHDLKPYSKYKDSGVEWLGRIPAHWKATKLRNLLKPVSHRKRPDFPLLSVVREKGVIVRDIKDLGSNHNFIPDDLSNYKVVSKGQFAMNKMKAWQGSYGVSDFDGIVSPAYYVFKMLGNVSPHFFHVAIRSNAYVPFFTKASDGVRIGQWDLSIHRMKEIPFFIPPRAEQNAIVRYLNTIDQRIHRFIHNRQQLIKVLNEQKQAIISRAVTRGLDPNVKLKPSGVEWLGEIPEHWKAIKLRNLLRPVSSRNRPDLPLLSVVREKGIIIRDIENFEKNHNYIPEDLSNYKVVRQGQFTINKMKAWQGSYGVSGFDGIVSPAYYVFKIIGEVLPHFFHVAIRSHAYVPFFFIASDGVRVGQWDLSLLQMKEIPFFVPMLDEQEKIVKFVKKQCSAIGQAISNAQREIDLILEYRTRLITDVVTGKMDVRHLVPDTEETALEDFESLQIDAGKNDNTLEDVADMEGIS